jgi:hypothetical protein
MMYALRSSNSQVEPWLEKYAPVEFDQTPYEGASLDE